MEKDNNTPLYNADFIREIKQIVTAARQKAYTAINSAMVEAYWQMGKRIPEIFATPWRILTWSHYKRLLQVSNPEARAWYLKEASEQMWSYRTLNRNIGSQYYERLLLSHKKEKVKKEMESLTLSYQQDKLEFIKNPTVAEFIGLSANSDFTENDLEGAIIGNLQKFLLE